MSSERVTFSLASLFGLLTLAATGAAALNYRTSLWASIIVTVTVMMLGGAVLLAVVARRKWRYFGIGFALFGLGYMLISFHPWLTNVGGHLLTTRVLAFAWTKTEKEGISPRYPPLSARQDDSVFEDDDDVAASYTVIMLPTSLGLGSNALREVRFFFVIGQSLFASLAGLLAGWAAAGVHALRARKEQREHRSSESSESASFASQGNSEDSHGE